MAMTSIDRVGVMPAFFENRKGCSMPAITPAGPVKFAAKGTEFKGADPTRTRGESRGGAQTSRPRDCQQRPRARRKTSLLHSGGANNHSLAWKLGLNVARVVPSPGCRVKASRTGQSVTGCGLDWQKFVIRAAPRRCGHDGRNHRYSDKPATSIGGSIWRVQDLRVFFRTSSRSTRSPTSLRGIT